MRITLAIFYVFVLAAPANQLAAQSQTSSPGPNSPFWSQGFNARSTMAMSLLPQMGNRLGQTVFAPKLLRMPDELGNMNYAQVFIAPSNSEQIVTEGLKRRGDLVATIPFRFRKTGVLEQAIRSERRGTGATVMAAGAQGYRISPFRITQGEDFKEAWCFTAPTDVPPTQSRRKPQLICFFNLISGGWISEAQVDAFPNTLRAPRSRRANIEEVVIATNPADSSPEKKLELRFEGWTSEGATLKSFVDGEFVELLTLPKAPSGEVELKLLGQTLGFSRSDARSADANVVVLPSFEDSVATTNQAELARLNRSLDENLVSWGTYHGHLGFKALNTRVATRLTSQPVASQTRALHVQPNDILATQSRNPAQAFKLQHDVIAGLKRYGRGDDLLFRVDIDTSLHVLCAYKADPLSTSGAVDTAPTMASYCLEDSDDDKLYDTVWRTPTFAPGSRYHLLDLASPLKINGNQVGAASGSQADADSMLPDILHLTYVGPIYYPVGTRPGLVQLKWHFGEGLASWPILAMSANFDASAVAVFTAESWRPVGSANDEAIIARVSNIKLSGEADIEVAIGQDTDPTILRRAAIESVVDKINRVAAARSALKPKS
jgi:hypothetical protein